MHPCEFGRALLEIDSADVDTDAAKKASQKAAHEASTVKRAASKAKKEADAIAARRRRSLGAGAGVAEAPEGAGAGAGRVTGKKRGASLGGEGGGAGAKRPPKADDARAGGAGGDGPHAARRCGRARGRRDGRDWLRDGRRGRARSAAAGRSEGRLLRGGPHCDVKDLATLLQPDETWAAAFRRLHGDEYERLIAAEDIAELRGHDGVDEEDDFFGDDDGGLVDDNVWWRTVGDGTDTDFARVVERANAAAVLKESSTQRTGFVRPAAGHAAKRLEQLNAEQRAAAVLLINALRTPLGASYLGFNDRPLRLLVRGVAGTGKSEVVKAVARHFAELPPDQRPERWEILLLGPTGKSASNVNGVTIHSGLGIDDGEPLSADRVVELRHK